MEKRSLPAPEDLDTGTWVVTVCNSTRSFMGRVIELDGKSCYFDLDDGKKPGEVARRDIVLARCITLFPAFDFFTTMLRPVPSLGPDNKPELEPWGAPKMAMSRDPLCNSLDFTLYPTPLDMLGHIAIYHFSQMNDADKRQHKEFMDYALKLQKQFRQKHSPIVAPTGTELDAVRRQHGRS
jgi:hypothetical protein